MTRDETFMFRAIELAKRGYGRTAPNPAVGAVVVKGGRVVGEGFHRKAGNAHAEVIALRRAGKRARGADLYVTLEPCCHWGKTPPCTDTIIAASIRRVVIGCRDPFPLVKGKGVESLRRARVRVTENILPTACEEIIRPFLYCLRHGVPHVTLKAAISLDGKIATSRGESRWLTGPACRRYVHELRDQSDAIVVGIETVLQDNPRLTVRLRGRQKNKLAIVVDSRLSLSPRSRLWRRPRGALIIATTNRAPKAKIAAARRRGHEVLVCRATTDGHVFIPSLLHLLAERGVTSLLVEGGGEIFASFLSQNVVHRMVICMAPIMIGGKGYDLFPEGDLRQLRRASKLRNVVVKRLGEDVIIEGDLR